MVGILQKADQLERFGTHQIGGADIMLVETAGLALDEGGTTA